MAFEAWLELHPLESTRVLPWLQNARPEHVEIATRAFQLPKLRGLDKQFDLFRSALVSSVAKEMRRSEETYG